jgi:hypothetical protein
MKMKCHELTHHSAGKGADPVDQRPGFADIMKHIAGNGVRTIIVETANRFARVAPLRGAAALVTARQRLADLRQNPPNL